ncbi:hypothetical protein [Pectobacterium brasiliense]|uniref:hypothetical protein n=1 Tax=Pectobacterium brasiliense TaxID=180957 RepID=UPI0019696060|nr:hypothetical protein [Pectobacterium brasiliense]MBN3262986.1 hypothetical protein [Pectobacterium brasiliense]
MNTPDATERRGVRSDRQLYRRSVKAQLAKPGESAGCCVMGWKPAAPQGPGRDSLLARCAA